MENPVDLSNFIVTIATSTAALIAIIGGFLISRVISLTSEQSSIAKEIFPFCQIN